MRIKRLKRMEIRKSKQLKIAPAEWQEFIEI